MKKLLVVDDEFIVRMGIRSIMNWEERGYTIVADASSGREALEKIAECRPDLVLTDLVMENMDGFELIRRCAAEYPELRFVVLSSYNDFENVRRAMKLGARDYIFKLGAGPEEILRVLDEAGAGQPGRDGMVRKLDTVIRENLPVIKSNLLRKWLNGSLAGKEELAARFSTLAPRVDLSKPYRVLYISIDDFERRRLLGEFQDGQLIAASLENIIRDVFNRMEIGDVEVFSHEKGDTAVFIGASPGGGSFETLRDVFFRILEYAKRYLGLAVSGTFSPVLEGTEDFPAVLRICAATLRQRTAAAELWPYNSGLRNEIARAMDYMRDHVTERPGIAGIASRVGMSESYFSHLFKKETGMRALDYLNRLKMEKAMEILKATDLKVADVAEQLGIENPNYFSALFKKITGFSPQEYRLRRREAPPPPPIKPPPEKNQSPR
ncbi:MAG: response regulator [Treponema sp.]|jgi:two-component system response regulator YesN|nr:response regulator [Treponema sp.]